jgi:hypothetical protein
MKKKEFVNNLRRRYLNEDGFWMVFCRTCGKHRPETEFYKKKGRPFGLDTRCKIHFNSKDEDDDPSMNYLKLNPLTDDDFKGAREVLQRLGYSFDTDVPIHIQFAKKHGLKH